MARKTIKNHSALTWVKIKDYYVRKSCIEIVNDQDYYLRTTSGLDFRLTKEEFLKYLEQTNFNEKEA